MEDEMKRRESSDSSKTCRRGQGRQGNRCEGRRRRLTSHFFKTCGHSLFISNKVYKAGGAVSNARPLQTPSHQLTRLVVIGNTYP